MFQWHTCQGALSLIENVCAFLHCQPLTPTHLPLSISQIILRKIKNSLALWLTASKCLRNMCRRLWLYLNYAATVMHCSSFLLDYAFRGSTQFCSFVVKWAWWASFIRRSWPSIWIAIHFVQTISRVECAHNEFQLKRFCVWVYLRPFHAGIRHTVFIERPICVGITGRMSKHHVAILTQHLISCYFAFRKQCSQLKINFKKDSMQTMASFSSPSFVCDGCKCKCCIQSN